MTNRTTLTRAASNSESLRTTVPRSIVKHFGLSEGDSVEWRLHLRESELVIEVSPVKRIAASDSEEQQKVRTRTLAVKMIPQEEGRHEKRRWRIRQKG
jgi:antitoxin component of MazEF toxin-antitoxin module